jgi:MFS family permease
MFLLLAALYFAQGLPYGFFSQALPVLMREQGYSLTAISAVSLLFIPWAVKFLWAPWVDHRGTRRGWLLPLQVAGVVLALGLTALPLDGSFTALFIALFLFNCVAATQDIATDGLAVRLLTAPQRGVGNGIQVGGYRIGMILGGGLLLWLYAVSGWAVMLVTMAGLLALTVIPVVFMPEPAPMTTRAPPSFDRLMLGWWARLRRPGLAGFIGLIALYKFGDTMSSAHIGPMMIDLGLTKTEIALIKGTVGSVMALAGAALGGALVWRLRRRTALYLCGILQAVSITPYLLAALGVAPLTMLWTGSVLESLCGVMATVALFALMMDASDPEHGGTDYTLLACIIVLVMGSSVFAGGLIGDHFGYVALLSVGMVGSAAGCLWLVASLDRGSPLERLNQVWQAKTTRVR